VLVVLGWCVIWGFTMGFSHCIGMCGIFVLGVNGEARTPSSVLTRQAMFQSGRLLSFATIGWFAGYIGSLAGFANRFGSAQAWASLITGIILALLAIGQIGWLPRLRLPEPDVLGLGGGLGRRLYARTLRSQRWWQPLVLGVFVGLLPCGLTYTAAIVAAGTLNPVHGLVVMCVFCLFTMPGLITLALSQSSLLKLFPQAKVRLVIGALSGWIMAIMAAVFIVRSVPLLHR
jgi:sulfite exporter TauE/SafE